MVFQTNFVVVIQTAMVEYWVATGLQCFIVDCYVSCWLDDSVLLLLTTNVTGTLGLRRGECSGRARVTGPECPPPPPPLQSDAACQRLASAARRYKRSAYPVSVPFSNKPTVSVDVKQQNKISFCTMCWKVLVSPTFSPESTCWKVCCSSLCQRTMCRKVLVSHYPSSPHAEKCVALPFVRGPCAEKCWSATTPRVHMLKSVLLFPLSEDHVQKSAGQPLPLESTCWKVCCSSLCQRTMCRKVLVNHYPSSPHAEKCVALPLVRGPCAEKCWSAPPSPPSPHAEKCVALPFVRGPCAEKCWSATTPRVYMLKSVLLFP